MQETVAIYCPNPTNRHHYIFNLIFEGLLGIVYTLTSDVNSCDINYSNTKGGKLQIVPHGLLDESAVNPALTIDFEKHEDQWFAFRTGKGSPISFDIFTASFYLVSRYEEYLPYKPDAHNRFPASASCLVKSNLIEEPLVNQWALYIMKKLSNVGDFDFSPRSFEYKSTIDIDQAWKFKYKGVARNILGTLRDIKEGKWENFGDRWPVLLGLKKDSFREAFDWHQSLEQRYAIMPTYFILLGDYGKYDKNTSFINKHFMELIKSLDSDNSLGIHPSYKSNEDKQLVAREIERLRDIVERPVTMSRQHFLMHKMPQTYHNLIANGIKEDHTMGYSTHLGFRAGIASPFYWFDLEQNKATHLKLIPFCAMDITPLHYREETPTQATQTLERLLDKVSAVGGLFVSLWHNESFSETERWKGWRKVYEAMLKKAQKLTS